MAYLREMRTSVPVWTPDSQRIAFNSNKEGQGTAEHFLATLRRQRRSGTVDD